VFFALSGSGVIFINAQADPKSTKKTDDLTKSACVKAACKTLVKSTVGRTLTPFSNQ